MSRNASASPRIRVAAGVAALITVACTASATASGRSPGADSPTKPREAAALTGSAKLSRTLGDDITFTFDAHLTAEHRTDPAKATGTFRFSHYLDGEGAWARGRIDCLVTGGKVAVATGVITGSDLPGAKGKRVGFTVHDLGRHDRLGYSWASVGNPAETKDLPKCVSSAPFERVKNGTGDFRVLPWQPDFVE
ncbi:hypothetical protein [Streptomyces pseudovenezuelae]|uniref:hypothetical protein n=1 Tax=Streptomyces pseudovenezuelae TaxID=67350 RepID=UPI002E81D69B|nr:hypothetical protein [Streptomyces pseudovenezuelae]WUA86412.1 hypothetical protein OHO81_03570 [Streptomyces pseudovenezuelae]